MNTDRVDELLAYKGQTRQWLAGQIGVSPGQLTKMLNGTRTMLPAVEQHISEALEVPQEWLR